MLDYAKILEINYPTAKWTLDGYAYEGLTWLDNTQKPAQAELDALWQPTQEAVAKANCKQTAKDKLANSDWSVLPDVQITNKADFVTYRAILRGLATQPQVSPDFPVEPQPVWS